MQLKMFEAGALGILNQTIDWENDDIYLRLVMSNTTVDTDDDGDDNIDFLSNFATIDTFDGTVDGGAYADVQLTSCSVVKDAANFRVNLTAANVLFANVAAGTRNVVGALIYKKVTNDADSIPIAFVQYNVAKTPNGGDFPVNFPAGGPAYFSAARGGSDQILYTEALYLIVTQALNWDTATIKARLVMSNTTCDTQNVTALSGFTTIDTYDGAGYADVTVTCGALVRVDASDLINFPATDITYTSLVAGTRTIAGILLYVDGVDDDARVPLGYLSEGSGENGSGADLQVSWPNSGVPIAVSFPRE